jgi:23S rRNA (guanine745-N1)-methyltransferase
METAQQRSFPDGGLAAAADRLRCPHCRLGLALADGSLVCPTGHRYDVARHGYVSLPAPRPSPHAGDSAEMAAARDAFLGCGHFEPITAALARAARAGAPAGGRLAVDLGAGTGYHLAGILRTLPGWVGLALDASRPALRRALRRDPRIAAVACDVWQPLPVRDAAADLAICVFAPRNGPELARILSPTGALLVVTPTPRHLQELGSIPGMLGVPADKRQRLDASLGPSLTRHRSEMVEFEMRVPRAQARMVVAMGPSARHVDGADLDRHLAALPPTLTLTASVALETFRAA